MRKNQCTSGVYLIIGEKGVRIGQSSCIERRVSEVQKLHEACIGKTRHVLRIPILQRKERLAMEKGLIRALAPKCNILGKGRS